MNKICLTAACATLSFLHAAELRVGDSAGPLTLKDQYNSVFQLTGLRGSLVFLIAGDREGHKFNDAWGRPVAARYNTPQREQVHIAYVAHLGSVPALMRGWVRGMFISKDPAHPNGPVLLDWQGAISKRFGLRENLANAYLIDREGILRFAGSGKGTSADREPLFKLIDGLLVP